MLRRKQKPNWKDSKYRQLSPNQRRRERTMIEGEVETNEECFSAHVCTYVCFCMPFHRRNTKPLFPTSKWIYVATMPKPNLGLGQGTSK